MREEVRIIAHFISTPHSVIIMVRSWYDEVFCPHFFCQNVHFEFWAIQYSTEHKNKFATFSTLKLSLHKS